MIGTLLQNRYRLEAELGRGGMGVVYRAHDTLLGRDVAVKLLAPSALDAESRTRLLREARAAAQLDHPNIVAVYDVGGGDEPDGTPYIVMQLVEGESLRSRMPQTLDEALSIGRQICAALDHAHSRGIIHRDLKPENVMLALTTLTALTPGPSPSTGEGRVAPAPSPIAGEGRVAPAPSPMSGEARVAPSPSPILGEGLGVRGVRGLRAMLTDFGLARSTVAASRLTVEGAIVGTVFYLAPEQALGQAVDSRADLYSFGVLLYELTAGRRPFSGDHPVAIISQHLHAPVVPPSTYNSQILPALDALILRLLSKQPDDRPASAAEALRALERLDLPETAPRPGGELSLLDRVVRGRMVAREGELAQANALWQQAVSGEAGLLLISGEPGIGKTRLARELMAQAQVSGAAVLLGECYSEGGAPYAPMAQIVQQVFDRSAGGRLGLPDPVLADLTTLAPELLSLFPEVPPNPALDPEVEQRRLCESVVKLCAALSAQDALLIVVEDAHWADGGTLFLLRHLARRSRPTNLRLLIVLTYREVELADATALYHTLLDLNRERLAERLKLARLTREQTGDLLAVMLAEEITPDFLEGIYRETEGNPFFVEEVCKGLIESGKLYRKGGRWHRPADVAELEIPQSLRLVIETRVAALPAATQDALRLAAILGREFDFDTLRKASDQDEETLIDALETAGRAQLVGEVRRGLRLTFAFAHALIPATLRESVSGLRRQRLHRRAAAAIESLHPDDYESLARHFAAAGDRTQALEYSRRAAGRAEAVYAYDMAVELLQAALDLIEPEEVSETRLSLLEQLGDVHSRLGARAQAIPLFEAALDLWRRQPGAGKMTGVRLYRKIIEAATRITRFEDYRRFEAAAQASSEAGLKLIEDEPPHAEAARLLTEHSRYALFALFPRDLAAAERDARAAVEMAEQLDAPVELSAALDALATVYGTLGQFRERVALSLRRLALSREPRFGDASERVSILNETGVALIHVGEYAQAVPHLLESERLAGQIQELDAQMNALRYQALCWYHLDRWDEVLEIESKCRELEKRYANFFDRAGPMCFHLALIASVYARRGDHGRADSLREESVALMTAQDPPERWGRSQHY